MRHLKRVQVRKPSARGVTAKARIWAERRCGELLKETDFAKGGQPYQESTPTAVAGVETLKAMGLTLTPSRGGSKHLVAPFDEVKSGFTQARQNRLTLPGPSITGCPLFPNSNGIILARSLQSQTK